MVFKGSLNLTEAGDYMYGVTLVTNSCVRARPQKSHRRIKPIRHITAPWWTYQPKSNIKKIPPTKLWPNSFSFWYFKVTKMKKMGCFRSSKRVTVPQSHMYEKQLSQLFVVKIEWDLKIWNKSGGEKYISFNDIF